MTEQSITLRFNAETQHLHDNEGRFLFLPNLKWDLLPWKADSVSVFDLYDLPCRLDRLNLTQCLKQMCEIAKNEAKVSFRLPHPRHDIFLMDSDYQQALLAETLEDLARKMNFPLEIEDIIMELDPDWKEAIEQKKMTYEEAAQHSLQAANVIEWIQVKMKVNKTAFRLATMPALTPEMRQQFMEQMEMQRARGNIQAVEAINKFLNGLPVDGT